MFLKILNDDKKYIGIITIIDEYTIRVEGLPHTTAGFQLYLNDKYERIIGDYSKYTSNYRTIDEKANIYEYTNDGHEYIEPAIEPPKPQPIEELYHYEPTIDDIKNSKIWDFKSKSRQFIEQGETVTLSDGSQDEFNYTQMNQMNLANAFNLAVATKDSVPYYDKDNVCKIYSAEDIIRIYSSCQILVTYHLTLAHQLADQIKNMDSIEEIKTLEYSYDSLDKQHKKNFDDVMAQTQKLAQKVFQQ
jgi:hypothetical protein